MISIIPSEDRYHADMGWLDTRWHFSFSDYHDPNNMGWGPLRVFNDDVVQGGGGFPPHPHRDMEIVSYVLEGALEHQDRLGNKAVLKPGEVQVMRAGKGIVHAEYNPSRTEKVHFLQLWIEPRNKGNPPAWEQKPFAAEDRANRLLPVVSGDAKPGALTIDQDATIYVSNLAKGKAVTHESSAGRKAYLFVTTGEVAVNGRKVQAGDQARIADETKLEIKASKDAELMLLDLPA